MRRLVLTLFGVLTFVACGGSSETESAGPARTSATSTTSVVTTTSAPTTTTTTISDERLAAAAAVGDIAAGEELFNEPLDGITHDLSCSSCHTLDGLPARNPTLVGIGTVAGDRIEGMNDVEYLRQSIVDPTVFKPEGEWLSAPMPYAYVDLLSEEQINNVIAYLLTQ